MEEIKLSEQRKKMLEDLSTKNWKLEQQLVEKEKSIKYLTGIKRYDIGELLNENIKLKQSQNKIAIKELEEIINLFEPYENGEKDTILCTNNGISFLEYIESRIKELGRRIV